VFNAQEQRSIETGQFLDTLKNYADEKTIKSASSLDYLLSQEVAQ
jgi:hypothetical protein